MIGRYWYIRQRMLVLVTMVGVIVGLMATYYFHPTNDKLASFDYTSWYMLQPRTIHCSELRYVGKQMPNDGQEPYSICFDEEYAFTPGDCIVYSFG